jgi:tetratricopeptide (TPR) repeat protein
MAQVCRYTGKAKMSFLRERMSSGESRGEMARRSAYARSMAFLLAFALMWTAAPAFCAQSTAQADNTVTIRGRVVSSARNAVAGVVVHLATKEDAQKAETVTDANGAFVFAGQAMGAYFVSAEKAGERTANASLTTSTPGEQPRIELVLGGRQPEQGMEFADAPTFTVAGVTDWTAAGGHGSDAILRTSEALTRETLTLKADAAKGGAGKIAPNAAKESADRHRLAGDDDEKNGNALAAVHEYEEAVHEDPSEENYFAWGSELLLHRAIWQAKDVFEQGVKAHPKSTRLLMALSSALFAGALYDEAGQRACEASELNPSDPEPYAFMGRIEIAAPSSLTCVEDRLARFAHMEPENSLANYLYAMAIWKQHGQTLDPATEGQVRALLTKAVTLDTKCSDGYLELGNLDASLKQYPAAIGSYKKAIEVSPELSEAHYRLAVAYQRVGDQTSAQAEFRIHDEIEKKLAAEVDHQRREIKQFVVVPDGKAAETRTP